MDKKLYKKYEEIIAYVFFGGLTTLVNIVVFFIVNDVLHVHYLAANAAAWLASVLFAYVTNRKWVFKSKCSGASAILREMMLFIGARVMSGLGDMLIMFVCVVYSICHRWQQSFSAMFLLLYLTIFSVNLLFSSRKNR